jgi:hypothetical protein
MSLFCRRPRLQDRRITMMSTALLALAIFAGILFSPRTTFAQQAGEKPPERNIDLFETLNFRVRMGQTIYVTDAARTQTEGQLVRLSDDSITLLVHGQEREFARGDIRQIVRRGDSSANGALIGAGVMGAWMLVATATSSSDPSNDVNYGAGAAITLGATIVALGAGVGALIDRAHVGKTTIYRSKSAAVTASPLLVNRAAGVRFVLSF